MELQSININVVRHPQADEAVTYRVSTYYSEDGRSKNESVDLKTLKEVSDEIARILAK